MFCSAVFAYTRAAKCEVTEDQVTFFLHNRNYGDGEAQLTFQNLDIVNTSKPIFFLIHGKGATRNSTWYYETTDAYLAAGDYNVVQVDYSGPAGQDEEGAVRDAEFVGTYVRKYCMCLEEMILFFLGQIIGKLISNLIQNYKLSPNDVTVIGHSLGGHVSGYTGKNVKNITGTAIAKIVGLDPANLENLTSISTDNKLYKEDAGLVVVIHTEGKEGGSFYQIGDIDFFPNGGQHPQPGCENQQGNDQ